MSLLSFFTSSSSSASQHKIDPICADASTQTSPQLPQTRPPSPPLPCCGSVGNGRLAKNFQFLFVNGCSYEEWESQAAARRISTLFGEIAGKSIKIHYTYIPMNFSQVLSVIRGGGKIPGDDLLLTSIRTRLKKLKASCRTTKTPQRALAACGRLAIFLHSGAGACFKSAMEHLTQKERKKIDVFGFGSAWLFKKEDFHDASNIIACWDPFPLLGQLLSGQRLNGSSIKVLQAGTTWQMPVASRDYSLA